MRQKLLIVAAMLIGGTVGMLPALRAQVSSSPQMGGGGCDTTGIADNTLLASNGLGGCEAGSASGTISGLTAPRVPFASSATTLADDLDMTFSVDTLSITKVISSSLTASRLVVTDASKQLASNGALTTNTIPKAASSGASLADSTITDDGTTVTVNTSLKATTTATTTLLGTGTGFGRVGGVLCRQAPNAATAGTTEEILATCTIPANTVLAGSGLRISGMAETAANGNNKRIRFRVGGIAGVLIYDSGTQASNNQAWTVCQNEYFAPSNATISGMHQYCFVTKTGGGIAGSASYGVGSVAVDWTASKDFVVTGETPSAAGDITLKTLVVEVSQ